MEQYLVQIEFRYNGADGYTSKTITLGVFDTRDAANDRGNKELELLESRFPLNPNWNKKERLSSNGGCFGKPNYLISDLGYLETPFDFFLSVKKLVYADLGPVIDNILSDRQKAIQAKLDEDELDI